MGKRVIFRDFEEKDVDFVFKTKNDKKIFEMTVAEYRPFSYEDAIEWVRGCMKKDVDYRFWAICTNDESQRIVGWCGVTNIDPVNRSVKSNGMIINDHEYNDGLPLYETHLFLMEYVFEILKYNRLYTTYLSDFELLNRVSTLVSSGIEGVMRQAIYKNGTYHDLTITAILRKEYLEHKSNGDYEIENIQQFLMGCSQNKTVADGDIDSFIKLVVDTLDDIDPSKLTAQTRFRELPEWSSLNALLMISMVNEEYKVALTGEEFATANTLEDVLVIINSKR